MYGKEQEIATIKAQLDLLLEKKSQLCLSVITTYDEEKKFGLKKQITTLSQEIEDLRQKLQELERPLAQSARDLTEDSENADSIRAHIASGELKSALLVLQKLLTGEDRNTVFLLQSRLNGLQKELTNDTISNDNAKLERAKIIKAALDLCNLIE